MYSYQRKNRKRNNKYRTGIAFFLLAVMVITFFGGKRGSIALWKKEFIKSGCNTIIAMVAPGLLYSEEKINVLGEMEKILVPIAGYSTSVASYETDIESSLSYEVIMAREAKDENYIDENTGELIIKNESENGQESVGTGTENEIKENLDATQTAAIDGQIENNNKLVEYSLEKLNDFDYLTQNFYQIDNTTTINGTQLNAAELLSHDMHLSHDASTPQILIYHTHSQEGYVDSIEGDSSTTVVGVGDYLTQLLTEKYGFHVIHHTGEYDVGDRDHAYAKSGPALEEILAEYPEIEVVIDLHRDGVKEGTRLATNINGTEMAQIMFFNGLSRTTALGDIDYLYNPYISDNLAFSFQMQLAAAEYYPDLTRRIYLKGYRYNMHYCPKTLLVEVGAQTNTLQEAKNAMIPLADLLHKVLSE